MNLFKGGKKLKSVETKRTLQQIQQEFNQVMFELGDLNYRKHMIRQELSKIESEINSRQQKADSYGVEARNVQTKMKAELDAKIEEGKNEAPIE